MKKGPCEKGITKGISVGEGGKAGGGSVLGGKIKGSAGCPEIPKRERGVVQRGEDCGLVF